MEEKVVTCSLVKNIELKMYACYTIITIYLICIRGLTHENITVERLTIGGLNLYVLVRTYRFINYPEHSSSIGFI